MLELFKRLIGAAILVGITASVSVAEEEAPPVFYPMPPIAIQYETKNCGYQTVMISTQLEYEDSSKTERISAFMPKIMANVYADLKKYLNKKKEMDDQVVKQMVLSVVNRMVGRGSVNDVLIMNVVHG